MPKWGGTSAVGNSGFVPLIRNRSNSQYIPIGADASGHLEIRDVGFATAFGEKSTAHKVPEGQYSFPMHLDVDQWNMMVSETGTCYNADSMLTVSTGTNTAASAMVISRNLMHYRSGQGILIQFSAVFSAGVADSLQRLGLGDATNGFHFGYSGESFGVFHYNNSATPTFIAQSSWSEPDKLDGEGDSGMNLDPTKPNVYMIQAQLHFMGKVNFYVVTNDCAFPKLVHTIKWPNETRSPLTTVAYGNLPVHVHAENTGNNTDITVQTASIAVFIEGTLRNVGHEFSTFVEQVSISGSANGEQTMLEIQNKAEVLGNTNHTDVIVNYLSVASDNSNAPSAFRVYVDANFNKLDPEEAAPDDFLSVGGTTYSDVNAASSAVEVDTTVRPPQPVITGVEATGGTATTITCASLSAKDQYADRSDYFDNRIIAITSGAGQGQTRRISAHAYESLTHTFTVPRWVTEPDETSVFAVVNGHLRRIITCGQNTSEVVNLNTEHAIHLPPGSRLTVTVQCNDATNRMMCALGWDEIQ